MDHPGAVSFGPYELDLDSGVLTADGRPVPLRPLATAALTLLVERRGRLTTREQLRKRLWGDQVLEWDQSLNQVVCQVRRVLGDGARRPRYVETVSRRGYRFIAEVRPVGRGTPSRAEKSSLRWDFGSFVAGVGGTVAALLLLFVGLCVALAQGRP